jgi:hypothetical protein
MSENFSVEEKIKASFKEFQSLSEKCGIPLADLIPVLSQFELVEINKQLVMLHEHIDEKMPLKKKRGKK